jgi:hypothetical protein
MEGITVPLALQDYMTPLFSTIGLIILTRMIYQLDQSLGRMAMIGTVLTVIGGFLKATHKLILASSGIDIFWMEQALFPFISPGFVIFAWALFQVRHIFRDEPLSKNPWRTPLITIAVFASLSVLLLFIPGPPWKVPIILLGTIGNVGMLIMLMLASAGRKMWFSSALFLITMVVVVGMSTLSGKTELSLGFVTLEGAGLIWFEQVTQSFVWMLFALGTWNYSQKIESVYGRRMAMQPA